MNYCVRFCCNLLGTSGSLNKQFSFSQCNQKLHNDLRLGSHFFSVPAKELAKNLIGKVLVRQIDSGCKLRGMIVETEAYLGPEDMASHSSAYRCNRAANNTTSLSLSPGHCMLTSVYGIHTVFSITSSGVGECVLIRALEPISGLAHMERGRCLKTNSKKVKNFKWNRLCSGPAKITGAMHLYNDINGLDLTSWSDILWMTPGPDNIREEDVVECPRIGLSKKRVGSWAYKDLRYYLLGHSSVSKRNRKVEQQLQIASGAISEDGNYYLS